jgi:arsenite-transporting ATPase
MPKPSALCPAKLTLFAGKGGVGKTTCAAAFALASAARSRRVLLVSTDPAHSLGDALGVTLSSRVRRVPGAAGVDALELDAGRAFRRWLDGNGNALGDILEQGTWLDRQDVDALLDLSVPGIDELMALVEIGRLACECRYDLVVVDTAPTGHTLRLLSAPDVVAAAAGILDALHEQHRIVRTQLARVGGRDAGDHLIAALAEQAHATGALMRDPARAAVRWVLLPEELSAAESEDGLAALRRANIHVAEILVNRVTPDGPRCPICDRRRAGERRVIAQLPRRLGRTRAIRIVAAELREPRGISALSKIGRRLSSNEVSARLRPCAPSGKPSVGQRFSAAGSGDLPPETIFDGARLILFAGKGGVGKTTCAAATAVRLARANANTPVLLVSTDPAPSLSDAFVAPIGDRVRRIPGAPANLQVREIDAAATLRARRQTLEEALTELVAAFGATDRGRGVAELLDLAPPGVDELFGMLSVAELTGTAPVDSGERPSIVVVDMAPTGHAIRLLEMPNVAREWVQALMRVLLKYRSIARPDRFAAELVDVSKAIRRFEERLRDTKQTRVVVVTRAAEVPRLETRRLLRRLRGLRLPAAAMVVNAATLAPGTCPRCRRTAAAERRERAELARQCRRQRCAMIVSPLAAPPPQGAAALDRWAAAWRKNH